MLQNTRTTAIIRTNTGLYYSHHLDIQSITSLASTPSTPPPSTTLDAGLGVLLRDTSSQPALPPEQSLGWYCRVGPRTQQPLLQYRYIEAIVRFYFILIRKGGPPPCRLTDTERCFHCFLLHSVTRPSCVLSLLEDLSGRSSILE